MSDTSEDKPEHCKEELELLKLLKDLQSVLATALNSLANQESPSVDSLYVVHAATVVNFTSDGYILLRENMRLHASKMMVRPLIEVVAKSTAVTTKKGFLSALAYTELQEIKRMYPKTSEYDATAKAQEDALRDTFNKDKTYPAAFKEYKIRGIFEVAGILTVYDNLYRLYCGITHSAVSAVNRHFDDVTDPIDTAIVAWAVNVMLNQLKLLTPAVVPDLRPFDERIERAEKAMHDAWNNKS